MYDEKRCTAIEVNDDWSGAEWLDEMGQVCGNLTIAEAFTASLTTRLCKRSLLPMTRLYQYDGQHMNAVCAINKAHGARMVLLPARGDWPPTIETVNSDVWANAPTQSALAQT